MLDSKQLAEIRERWMADDVTALLDTVEELRALLNQAAVWIPEDDAIEARILRREIEEALR